LPLNPLNLPSLKDWRRVEILICKFLTSRCLKAKNKG
jgi:hypothetical protein